MVERLQQLATAVRGFNRFYTKQIGLLEEGLHRSAFSLAESRVLYELAQHENFTATALGRQLGLDAGYLSRLLKSFVSRGLVARMPSATDGRQTLLTLTPAGRAAFAPLNEASQTEIVAMLARLPPSAQTVLVSAMRRIESLLTAPSDTQPPYRIRALKPGDLGWIIHRQAVLYAQEYGWDETFEGLVAEIAGAFVKNFDPAKERCWIAEREGEIVGSIFLVRQSDEIAKLRMLYVEPSARGLGIGQRLVEECIAFARERKYRVVTLWTNDILTAARRIYEKAGFVLVEEERHHSFGKDLVGQTWTLSL